MIRGSLPPVSSRSTLLLNFVIIDPLRDEGIDFTGSDLWIEITPLDGRCCGPAFKADLTSGLVHFDKGFVQLQAEPSRHRLRPGYHTVRLFVSAHGLTSELVNATLPVEV